MSIVSFTKFILKKTFKPTGEKTSEKTFKPTDVRKDDGDTLYVLRALS